MAMTIQDPQTPVSPSSPGATDTPAHDKPTTISEDTDKPKVAANNSAPSTNGNNVKRKPSRRANTAERRATHNAVERQRRETLNGRFLDLAALLPNLSQIRRPSKSSIVNSSIAYIHASRRHRLIASREVRSLTAEAHALRRELNEWRDRASLPRVEEPLRSEGYHVVVGGEMDAMMVSAEMGAAVEGEEGEEGMDEWGVENGGYEDEPMPPAAHQQQQYSQQQNGPFVPQHPQQQQQYAPHPYAHPGHPGHHHPGAHPGHPSQHPGAQHQGHHGGHAMGFMDDERPVSKGGNPFAHNIPRGYGGEAGQGAGALFTPPVSRDGPIHPGHPSHANGHPSAHSNGSVGGASVNGGGSNGGASPAHSSHSHHSGGGSPSPVVNHARSMSGSPTGFTPTGSQGRRGASGSPSYELGPSGPGAQGGGGSGASFGPYTHAGYAHGYQGQGGHGGGAYQNHGGHLMQSGPGMAGMGGVGMSMGVGSMQGGMGGVGGGMGQMQGQGMAMGVGVGAGARGGVFGMML